MKEVIKFHYNKIINSSALNFFKLKKNEYFLVSFHREENVQYQKLQNLNQILEYLSNTFNYPIIFSTHPRTKKIIKKLGIKFNKKVKLIKPLSFTDYNNLQLNSYLTLSDSGTISEEASILKFNALNLRENHERHEAMEEAVVMMIGTDMRLLKNSLKIFSNKKMISKFSNFPNKVFDYDIENVSYKIPRIIISYINYVKTNIWKQY